MDLVVFFFNFNQCVVKGNHRNVYEVRVPGSHKQSLQKDTNSTPEICSTEQRLE